MSSEVYKHKVIASVDTLGYFLVRNHTGQLTTIHLSEIGSDAIFNLIDGLSRYLYEGVEESSEAVTPAYAEVRCECNMCRNLPDVDSTPTPTSAIPVTPVTPVAGVYEVGDKYRVSEPTIEYMQVAVVDIKDNTIWTHPFYKKEGVLGYDYFIYDVEGKLLSWVDPGLKLLNRIVEPVASLVSPMGSGTVTWVPSNACQPNTPIRMDISATNCKHLWVDTGFSKSWCSKCNVDKPLDSK